MNNYNEIKTDDGRSLKVALEKSLFQKKLNSFLLVTPLLLFIVVTFIFPIGDMLFRSVENQIVSQTLPKTVNSLNSWDESKNVLPSENTFRAFALDLSKSIQLKTHTRLGSRLNYEMTGIASAFRKSGRKIKKWDLSNETNFKEKLIKIDKKWGNIEFWKLLKLYSPKYTNGYFLNSIDLKKTSEGFSRKSEDERIYILLFKRTIFMSITITILCFLLGYPIAYFISNLPIRKANLFLIMVLLPFWTSLLVRTSAWKVLLQQEGVINDILVSIGFVDNLERFQMINNQFGTIVAMTHILLPFMIFL